MRNSNVKMKEARKDKPVKSAFIEEELIAKAQFKNFIIEENHPCVMAQTVFSMDQVDFHVYDDFGSKNTARKILKDLKAYLNKYDFDSNDFFTFMASFRGRKEYTEKQFEELLWKQLEFIH